ncbi:MAG: TetR family transcriptional regulator [Gammaproteobacteria bacterium]|nr:TetR family transcriptional regulator [Gammaproteobacteria bacterium]
MKCNDCCLFVRARKPEQVAQRRESIIVAMADLLREMKPEQISLNEVARRAGLAKSNLYRYFDSREAILLELLKEDSLHWIMKAELALKSLESSNDMTATTTTLAKVTAAETRMCQLLSQISSGMEQQISDTVIFTFNQHIEDMLDRLTQALHKTLPALPLNELSQAMRYVIALLIGLWQQSNLSKSALSLKEMAFEEELQKGLLLIFCGLANAKNKNIVI